MPASQGRFISAAVVLAALVTGAARADDFSSFYLGGNFGRARNSYDTAGNIDSQIYSEAQSAGETAQFTRRDIKKMSDAWWADVGYFFTPNFAIDAAFMHLGEIKYGATGTLTSTAGSQSLETTDEAISHGPALALVFRVPLTESLAIDLRAGDYYGKTVFDSAVTVNSNLFFEATTKTKSALLAGFGASYNLTGHCAVRVDYLHVHHAGDAAVGVYNVNLVTGGLSFFF